jgi:hypothetical protein
MRDAVKAFQLVGHRPEDFDLILQQAVISGSPLGTALTECAVLRRVEMLNELKRQLAALTPLQRAVLRHMANEDAQFAPFTAAAFAFYAKYCESSSPGSKHKQRSFTTGDIQRALHSLERKHRLVWRSARGAYALDDHMIGEVLNEEHVAEEMRVLTDPSSANLSAEELREHGFFADVPDDEWPEWEK